MLPEKILVKAFKDNGITAYTNFNDLNKDQCVVIVRTSSERLILDMNRVIKGREYNFLIHCLTKSGNEAIANFSEEVSDILDDLYWNDNVNDYVNAGGSEFPSINDYSGYTVSISLTLN